MRRKIYKMNKNSLDQFPNFLRTEKSLKDSIVVEITRCHTHRKYDMTKNASAVTPTSSKQPETPQQVPLIQKSKSIVDLKFQSQPQNPSKKPPLFNFVNRKINKLTTLDFSRPKPQASSQTPLPEQRRTILLPQVFKLEIESRIPALRYILSTKCQFVLKYFKQRQYSKV